MAYTSNTPQATQKVSTTQPLIRDNFQALSWVGNGYADFAVQSGAPTFAAGKQGLYNLNNSTTSKNELYIHKQTQAGTADIPFSASILSNTASSKGLNGWTYLPSGILLKWGASTADAGGNISFNLNSLGPNYTQIFNAMASPNSTSKTVSIFTYINFNSTSASTLVINVTNGTTGQPEQARWLTIGV